MMYANASVEITMEEKHNDLTEIITMERTYLPFTVHETFSKEEK